MATIELPRFCVLTIQGGGALGVEMVGQLQGILGSRQVTRESTGEVIDTGDHEMQVVGVAGTSAGAIIAALVWSGYKPEQIRDALVETFADGERDAFFGPYDRCEIRSFRSLLKTLHGFEAGFAGVAPAWLPTCLLRRGWRRLAPTFTLLRLGAWLIGNLSWLSRRWGLLRAHGFEARIDTLLRRSPLLAGHVGEDDGTLLTFSQVRKAGQDLFPLFLMVTDADSRALRIVSSIDPELEHLPIARAVRASAGFPGFFQPVALGDWKTCVDGGVISNVPTWVFDRTFRAQLRQRTDDRVLARMSALPWYHVALRLTGEDEIRQVQSGTAYLKSLWSLLSGIGRRRLEDRMVSLVSAKQFTIMPPPLPVARTGKNGEVKIAPAGVLDFAALADQELVERSFRRGRAAAQEAIDRNCFRPPDSDLVIGVLQALIAKVEAILRPMLQPRSLVRANVFLPTRPDELRMAYKLNFGTEEVDYELVAEQRKSITALTFFSGRTLLANLRDKRLYPQPPPDENPFNPAVPEERTWLLSVPILDYLDATQCLVPDDEAGELVLDARGPIYGVLNLDACVVYGDGGLDSDPLLQTDAPVVRLTFDAMRVAAEKISNLFNAFWIG